MGSFSVWHWLIVLALVLLLFGGGGKIPKLMGDMAKGVKAFKQGLNEGDAPQQAQTPPPAVAAEAKPVNHQETTHNH